jgi:hypothetical protein
MRKNVVQPDRLQMTIWGMRIACLVATATSIHADYVILIAFKLEQRLHEHASMLRYTYIACLVDTIGTHLMYGCRKKVGMT